MARKFFTSHAKTKQFTRRVFRGHKHENFGAQTDLELSRCRNILNAEPVRFATIQADRKKERSTRRFVRTTLPLMDPVTVY
ncbi:hypothetical protein HMPREF1989_01324 [Porphyromonas gingivalis F0566]|nr:hypothetical protein HMPREF1989_01324 [Porphyromonas gingivalis F0566]